MIKIGIILGSTRPGRVGEQVAHWVYEEAKKRGDAEVELVDIAEQHLPLLDEPVPPSLHQYSNEHTRAWAAKIAPLDAFVFVSAEYNHGIPGALKNAIDFLYEEWNDKAAGFVSYGSAGGSRAVESLRLVMAELQVADVRAQLLLYLDRDFENYRTFQPKPQHAKALGTMLDQLIAWGTALQPLRQR